MHKLYSDNIKKTKTNKAYSDKYGKTSFLYRKLAIVALLFCMCFFAVYIWSAQLFSTICSKYGITIVSATVSGSEVRLIGLCNKTESLEIKSINIAFGKCITLKAEDVSYKYLEGLDIKAELSYNIIFNLSSGLKSLNIHNRHIDANIYYDSNISALASYGDISHIPVEAYNLIPRLNSDVDKVVDVLKYLHLSGRCSNLKWKTIEKKVVGSCNFNDTYIRYYEGMPYVEKASGNAILEGNNLRLNIDSAKSIDTYGKGIVDISLSKGGAVTVDINAKGPLNNLLKCTSGAEVPGFIASAKGVARTHIYVYVPYSDDESLEYKVSSKVSIPNIFIDPFDLKHIDLDCVYIPCKLDVLGSAILKEHSKVKIDYKLHNNAQSLNIKSNIDHRDMDNKFIKTDGGYAYADVNWAYNNEREQNLSGILDLQNIQFSLPYIGIKKQIGEAMNLNIGSSNMRDFAISIKSSRKKIADAAMQYSQDVFSLDVKNLKYKDASIEHIKIFKDQNHSNLGLRADSLNLSEANLFSAFNDGFNEESTKKKFKCNIFVRSILMKNSVYLSGVDFVFTGFKGKFFSNINGDKYIKAAYSPEKGWAVVSDSAASVLASIGAMPMSRKHGKLIAHIRPHDKEDIADFTIYNIVTPNMPIFARIVSFTSFHGLIGLVAARDEIPFTKIEGNILPGGNISLNADSPFFDIRMHCALNGSVANIAGNLLPKLYGITDIIGNVPIMKYIFTGGKKRNGLLSTSFSFKEKF